MYVPVRACISALPIASSQNFNEPLTGLATTSVDFIQGGQSLEIGAVSSHEVTRVYGLIALVLELSLMFLELDPFN